MNTPDNDPEMTLPLARRLVTMDVHHREVIQQAHNIVNRHDRHQALLRNGWCEAGLMKYVMLRYNRRFEENGRYYRCVRRKGHLIPPEAFGRKG